MCREQANEVYPTMTRPSKDLAAAASTPVFTVVPRREWRSKASALATGVSILTVLYACQDTGEEARAQTRNVLATCPDDLRREIDLSASSVPASIPPGLRAGSGTVDTNELMARRIMISLAVGTAVPSLRVFSSSLVISTVGGTFAGWAALDQVGPGSWPPHHAPRTSRVQPADRAGAVALDVIPGRIRIRPFVTSQTLSPQTRRLDVLIVPGGVPEDHVVITTAQIWTTDFHPVRPGALQVTLLPVRHLTAIDSVDATLRLELTAATSSFSRARWRCSFESHLQLVDHEAALPLLWDLREDARGSNRQSWLALYDPATGPIRALFDSPVRARSFARWLRDTRSLKAGTFQLGMLEQNDGDATHAGTQTDPQVTSSFRPATPDDLGALEVRRLGEN